MKGKHRAAPLRGDQGERRKHIASDVRLTVSSEALCHPPLHGALSASTHVPCQEVLALSPWTNQPKNAAERVSFPAEKARWATEAMESVRAGAWGGERWE